MGKIHLSRAINIRFLRICAFLIKTLVPSQKWYKAILLVTYFTRFKITHRIFKKYPYRFIRAFDINSMLDLLSKNGTKFPIPYRFINSEAIKHDKGLIICTTHYPLSKMMMRALDEHQTGFHAVIFANPVENQLMPIWGSDRKVPVLHKNQQVLFKVKSFLNQNQRIGLMVDQQVNGDIAPNIFGMCQLAQSKVIFFFTELKKDNSIECKVIEFPHPHCENEEQIQENVHFLNEERKKIWESYHA